MTDQNSNPAPKPRRATKPKPEVAAPAALATKPSKKDRVLALLRRKEGATLEELVSATGWLAHTTRAALTGLRKAGHTLEKGKRGKATCYSIKASA